MVTSDDDTKMAGRQFFLLQDKMKSIHKAIKDTEAKEKAKKANAKDAIENKANKDTKREARKEDMDKEAFASKLERI